MNRRRVLQSIAAATGALAGCTTTRSDSTSTTPPATTTAGAPDLSLGEETAVSGYGTVRVDDVTVQRSVIHHHLWREVYEPADGQMLVVHGSAENDDAAPEFRVRRDGDTDSPADSTRLRDEGVLYALSVPVDDVESAAVVLQAGDRPAWTLPAAVRDALGTSADFHLHDAAIRGDDEAVLDLTVENTGAAPGTFRAVAEHASASDADTPIRFDVEPGETVTERVGHSVIDSWTTDRELSGDVTPDIRRFAVS